MLLPRLPCDYCVLFSGFVLPWCCHLVDGLNNVIFFTQEPVAEVVHCKPINVYLYCMCNMNRFRFVSFTICMRFRNNSNTHTLIVAVLSSRRTRQVFVQAQWRTTLLDLQTQHVNVFFFVHYVNLVSCNCIDGIRLTVKNPALN